MRILDFLIFLLIGTSIPFVKVAGKPAAAGNNYGVSLPGELARVRKRKEESSSAADSYLEQCGLVEFPNAKRGLVNVLAFLDSSWPYSHRQAIMLNMLNDRLQKSGLRDTRFFVVNIDPYNRDRIVDTSTEDEIEREAWLGVSPEEIEGFAEIDKSFDSLAAASAGINVIQDNEELGVWRTLGGSRDQVLVIDRCGKLTYQVIVPWSILHFPYVKAAILSTYNDEPCGACHLHENETRRSGDLDDLVEASSETIEDNLGSFKDAATLNVNANGSHDLETGVEFHWLTSTLKIIDDTTIMDDDEVTVEPATESQDPIAHGNITTANPGGENVNYRTETVLGVEEGFGSTIMDPEGLDTTVSTMTDENAQASTTEGFESSRLVTTEVRHFVDVSAAPKMANASGQSSTVETINFETTTRNPAENVIDESSPIIASNDDSRRHFVDARATSKMADDTSGQTEKTASTYLPIRIIMHAPHFHVDTDSTRMHEYLVLKTGSTNAHGHLSTNDATRLYRGPQDYQEKRTNATTEEIVEKKWPMKNLIFNKDESTGLFGEVADYWRDMASQENYEDEMDENERPDDDRVYQEATAGAVFEQTSSQKPNEKFVPTAMTKMTDANAAESWLSRNEATVMPPTRIDKLNTNEEEEEEEEEEAEEQTRQNLIAHYSKLLPWIYYVLDE